MKNILFLCTGNSCRSIMAEALLNHMAERRLRAFSAGSFPTGHVHPASLATLTSKGIPSGDLRSKSWSEFTDGGQPIDIVITVCDAAAAESCPVFPGAPIKAHWSTPDPGYFRWDAVNREAGFLRVCELLEARIAALLALPLETMESERISLEINRIGKNIVPGTP